MRLPNQAIPVVRGIRGSRPAAGIAMSSWGSCMVSCMESSLNVTGLSACENLTSISSIESCAWNILKALPNISEASVIKAAVSCGVGCTF